jgi:hypothetical protein
MIVLLVVLLSGCAGADNTSSNTTNTTDTANSPSNTNKTSNNSASTATKIPEFPWPPDASAITTIPSAMLVKPGEGIKLGNVDDRLQSALQKGGYEQPGYYHIPGGFVVVTQLEQFDAATGAPLAGANRWSTKVVPPKIFTKEYFTGLIKGNSGHFRVIAFAVTKEAFTETDKEPSAREAANLHDKGLNRLPVDIRDQPFTDDYRCSALVYEFLQPNSGPAQFVRSSGLLASQHLQKILPALEQPQ